MHQLSELEVLACDKIDQRLHSGRVRLGEVLLRHLLEGLEGEDCDHTAFDFTIDLEDLLCGL